MMYSLQVFSLFLPVLTFSFHSGQAQLESEGVHWSVKQLVEFHQRQHPNLKVQDVYKLFYQSSFGVEHILSDSASIATYLMEELQSLGSSASGEPLLERISLDDEMVRVNLRPFNALNLGATILVKVMLQSARETIPDTTMFYRIWHEFSALVRFGVLKFVSDDLTVWLGRPDESIGAGGDEAGGGSIIRALHHSAEYAKSNRPAYRVVRRGIFEATFGKMTR